MTTSSSAERPITGGPVPPVEADGPSPLPPADRDAFATRADVQASSPALAAGSVSMTETLPAYPLGRYRIEKLLGRGGMGSVYLARDLDLDRPVALKIPNFSDAAPAESVERFFREARSAATISHPNICPVYDAGDTGGIRYMAMGYIDGRPLSEFIKPGRPQSERQAAAVIRKLALAIQEAHDHGIVHRDLKPGNIMIDRRSEPILMDFGLAKNLQDETQSRLTQEGLAVGTPAYMSPEQVQGRTDVGAGTDVYSLGVILYELLTATQPFRGTIAGILGQILHTDAKPVRELRPDVSPELESICSKAMQKDPKDRFASMREFALALTNFLKAKPGTETGTMEMPPGRTSVASIADRSEAKRVDGESADATVGAGELESAVVAARRLRQLPASARRTRKVPEKQSPRPVVLVGIGIAVGVLAVLLLPALFKGRPGATPQDGSQVVAAVDGEHAPPAPNGSVDASQVDAAPLAESGIPAVARGASPETSVPTATVVVTDVASEPISTNPNAAASAASPLGDDDPKSPAPVAGSKEPSPMPAANTTPPSEAPDGEKPATPAGSPEPVRPPPSEPLPRNGREPPPPPNGQRPNGPPNVKKELERFDANGDGTLTDDELPPHVFSRSDTNRDGKVTLREFEAAYKKYRDQLHVPPRGSNDRPPPRNNRPPR